MSVAIKICGLTTPEAVRATADARADFAGFMFAESRRLVTLSDAASLAAALPPSVRRVAVTVDADDATLDAIVAALRPQALQLHGHESPARVAAVKARTGLTVIKALPVASAADLDAAAAYDDADWLLLDSAPAAGAPRGGSGRTFDWALLGGRRFARPWMLSGGLTPENVAAALAQTHAPAVDVSSGVESAPGVKDPARIARFADAVRAAVSGPVS